MAIALVACLCGVAAAFSNPRHFGASRLACPALKAEPLKIGEVLQQESCSQFAAGRSSDGWKHAWVHRRRGWGDDLVLQGSAGAETLVNKASVGSAPVFSPDGSELAVVVDGQLEAFPVAGGAPRRLRTAACPSVCRTRWARATPCVRRRD